jgi:ribosomal protein S18 acetylase RimI-like enzyme
MKSRIDIRRADDTSALFDFQCGVQSMDDFIHDPDNGLAKFIKLRLSNLWIVFEKDKAVAFFALSKDALILNHSDRQTIERDKEKANALAAPEDADKLWEKEKYPAIEIDYLAVCKEKREEAGEHLGTAIIQKIAQFAANDKLSATMFLTVEALDTKEYSAVEFYRNCDFEFSEVAQNKYNYELMYGNQPTTRRMYKLIIPFE